MIGVASQNYGSGSDEQGYLNRDLCSYEVQSYILAERCIEQNDEAVASMVQDFVHMVLHQYYIERQCLLKCSREILMYSALEANLQIFSHLSEFLSRGERVV
ncbi:hypothetical protein ACFE04_031456 [Oxalis oulophora]